MKSLVIVGAGGHGVVVADILLAARDAGSEAEPVAFVDDDESVFGTSPLGIPVAGRLRDLPRIPHDAIVLAVGRNAQRARLFEQLTAAGELFATACHPRATVARGVSLGAGTVVCAGVVINSRSVIGRDVILNTGCSVDHDCEVADHAHIAPGARLAGSVRVSEGALVGILAALLPGRVVGAWSTVGAGAVVTKDVEPGVVVVGVPALSCHRSLERS